MRAVKTCRSSRQSLVEHYPEDIIGRTRELYRTIRSWAEDRTDVSIIGGWLVFEHVKANHAQQSRDVDLVLHDEGALRSILENLGEWNLELRKKGRNTFPDAHFADEEPTRFRLDLFTTRSNPLWDRLFGRNGFNNIKSVPNTLFPDLAWLIQDKLETLPRRAGPDRADKRVKDLIDVYHLVFFNRSEVLPQDLARSIPLRSRQSAREFLAHALQTRPGYAEQFEFLGLWLMLAE